MQRTKEEIKRGSLLVNKIARDKGLLKVDFYKALTKRTFKQRKNYPGYEQIILTISTSSVYLEGNELLSNREHCINQVLSQPKQVAELLVASEMFFDQQFPVYSVDEGLINLFSKTDVPKGLQGVMRLFRNCLFVLPKKSYIDDLPIDWIFITDVDASEVKEGHDKKYYDYINLLLDQKQLTDKEVVIEAIPTTFFTYQGRNINIYCGCSDLGLVYCSGFAISESGGIEKFEVDILDSKINLSISGFEAIAIQLLLFLQCPENQPREEKPDVTYKGVGFNVKSTGLTEYSYRHLYQKQKDNNSKKSINHKEHSSAITHWRRGHWRNQPCGEKLQDSKIIWIQPTLINPV
jgi:hypothetical protein